MLEVDFHCHSTFSSCGLHSFLELLNKAKEKNMKGLAITDHGTALGGHLNSVFFERLIDPVPGIKLLKGIELNLLLEKGKIDIPKKFVPYMDVVLLGIHPNIPTGLGKETYTNLLIEAMKNNKEVDIITHPNDPAYPIDFDKLALNAKRLDIAIELNNSKNLLNRTTPEMTIELLTSIKKHKTLIAINSDAHAITEIGLDDSVRPFIEKTNIPEEQIVNQSAQKAFEFIKKRRKNKLLH